MRRAGDIHQPLGVRQVGRLSIDFEHYTAREDGKPVEMSPREFEMLKLFIHHEGETLTRDQFLRDVWGYDTAPSTRTVDNFVAKLRQRIEEDPEHPRQIITVHRIGYRYIA